MRSLNVFSCYYLFLYIRKCPLRRIIDVYFNPGKTKAGSK